jgi:hypothetical protein
MRRRLIVFAVPLLSVAVALAGCGGSGGGGGTNAVSVKTMQLAADNTAQAESMSFTVDTSGGLGGKQFMGHAIGVTSGDGKFSRITFTSGELAESEVRTVDGVVYLKLGGDFFGSIAPAGKSWARLDFGGSSESPFGNTEPSTPKSGLDLLKDLTGGVETIGDDTVAGRHATHYRGSIDSAKIPGGDDTPVDVWIDDADRVVKMHLSMGSFGAELAWEVTEFGVPVEVPAPPPDEVMTLSDLFRLGSDGIPA